jgi:hypothetical protein
LNILKEDKYKDITQDKGKSFTWAPKGGDDVEVHSFGNDSAGGIDSTFTLDKIEDKKIKIGQFYARGGGGFFSSGPNPTHWKQKETPEFIEIGELKIPDPNKFDANITAKNYIDIKNIKLHSSGFDEINISAPTVIIGEQGGDGIVKRGINL